MFNPEDGADAASDAQVEVDPSIPAEEADAAEEAVAPEAEPAA